MDFIAALLFIVWAIYTIVKQIPVDNVLLSIIVLCTAGSFCFQRFITDHMREEIKTLQTQMQKLQLEK